MFLFKIIYPFGNSKVKFSILVNCSAFSGTTLNYHSITGGHYYSPQISTGSGTGRVCEVNFGSPSFSISSGNADANGYGNFEYAVPSGFFSLCSKNLAEYG